MVANSVPAGAVHSIWICFHSCVPCTSSVRAQSFSSDSARKSAAVPFAAGQRLRFNPPAQHTVCRLRSQRCGNNPQNRYSVAHRTGFAALLPAVFSPRSSDICMSCEVGRGCHANPQPRYPDSNPPSHTSEPAGSGGGAFCIIPAASGHRRFVSATRPWYSMASKNLLISRIGTICRSSTSRPHTRCALSKSPESESNRSTGR